MMRSPAEKCEDLLLRPDPVWMGILNTTPDSFSDGGQWLSLEAASERAAELVRHGAKILDVGGLSTRPGSEPVPPEVELARVQPVLTRLRSSIPEGVLLSIDTYRPSVAAPLAEQGLIDIINDVSAGLGSCPGYPGTMAIAAMNQLGFVAMHMQGSPKNMQTAPHYEDCLGEIADFLLSRAKTAQEQGVRWVAIDPGIGFGKTFDHNRSLLEPEALRHLSSLGFPLLIGLSRKRFLEQWFPADRLTIPHSRDARSKELELHCIRHGARVIRSHRMPQEVKLS